MNRRFIATFAAALLGVLASPFTAKAQEKWPENPAKAADPSLIPPGDPTPISSSGTDLSSNQPEASSAVVVSAGGTPDEKVKELEARISADEKRIRRLEGESRILKNLTFSGYVQPQFLLQSFDANASPNQVNGVLPAGIGANDVTAKADGTTTNGTFFRMRRTRFKVKYETEIMRYFLQIDPFPTPGVGTGVGTVLRDATATGIAHWHKLARTEFSAGLYMTPVSYELRRLSVDRPYIERSWAIRNIFPAERDIGVQARTLAFDDRLTVDLGIVNGQHLGEPFFTVQPDLNKQKDFYGHVSFRFPIVDVGVSGYWGRGSIVDTQQLRFKQYDRWWVDYDVEAHYRFAKALGDTTVAAELAIGQNMDTGIRYAFAVPTISANFGDDVKDLHERMLILRAEQELTRWAMVGYRYDFYTTDTSIANNARDTHAIVAIARFGPHLRWMNEVDYAIDNIHPTGAPAASRHILAWSSVLQAAF